MRTLILLGVLGCSQAPPLADTSDEDAPEVVGNALRTELHNPRDGQVFARLRAEFFSGDRDGQHQSLTGVTVELLRRQVVLRSEKAELSGRNLQMWGKVRGVMPDGRRFEAPRLEYFSGPGMVSLSGPAVFKGDGHRLVAEGGAVADEAFDHLELQGPVRGRVQTR